MTGEKSVVLELVPLKSEKNKTNSSHAHKTGSWCPSGVLFKISNEHARPFYMESPLGSITSRCSSKEPALLPRTGLEKVAEIEPKSPPDSVTLT